MYQVFLQHVKDLRIIFEQSDIGEVYAIAIAKTIGCICIVTDDIKERGPHYTLMRMIESDVIPLAFFEILLLDYLERNISEEELINMYQLVCQFSGITWRFESKLKGFIKRFWSDPYNKNEKEWMNCFCKEKEINAKERILELLKYMNLK